MKMSLERRNTSAMNERAEQLKRWYDSDTNREPAEPKSSKRKIKFSPGCVFLAACAAADKTEVQFLLDHGADINTTNVDGLTALHQACIDNNLDMVEFLVHNGANINQGDNEGWTPLHATSSCGFTSIAKFLLDNGADIAAVNIDGDLPCDICYLNEDMEELLFSEMRNQGVKEDEARRREENQMYEDVLDYVNNYKDNRNILKVNTKNGATSLHVAASKGYLRVLDELLKSNCIDIDTQDFDGWTPLHAAAHWGNSEACEMLIKNYADTEIKSNLKETVFEVARKKLLDKLRIWDQEQDKAEVQRRKSDRRRLEAKLKANEQLPSPSLNRLQPQTSTIAESGGDTFTENENIDRFSKKAKVSEVPFQNKSSHVGNSSSTSEQKSLSGSEHKETVQNCPLPRPVSILNNENTSGTNTANSSSSSSSSNRDDRRPISHSTAVSTPQQLVAWIKPVSQNNRLLDNNNDSSKKVIADNTNGMKNEPEVSVAEMTQSSATSSSVITPSLAIKPTLIDSDISLRRTQSFESDKKFYLRYLELHARIKASSNPVVTTPPPPIVRSAISAIESSESSQTTTTTTTTSTSSVPSSNNSISTTNNVCKLASSTTTTTSSTSSSSNHFINSHSHSNSILTTNHNNTHNNNSSCTSSSGTTSIPSSTNVNSLLRFAHSDSNSNLSNKNEPKNDQSSQNVITKRSFVPPVRDEESETQRKAHAKRVRETRRSTQGVTLDEIKSAEELIKKQQQEHEQKVAGSELSNGCDLLTSKVTNETVTVEPTMTTTTTTTTIAQERRPSWRLRVDNGSKFALEDASKDPQPSSLYSSSPIFSRRHSSLVSNAIVSTPPITTSLANSNGGDNRGNNGNSDLSSNPCSSSATSTTPSTTTTATVTLALRRQTDNELSFDSTTATAAAAAATTTTTSAATLPPSIATQAAIQRRRRPKRRSTGVVNVDLDEIINSENGQIAVDRKDSDDEDVHSKDNRSNSGSESSAAVSTNTTTATLTTSSTSIRNNGNSNNSNSDSGNNLDYKKLWEESCLENGLLKDKLRKSEEELRDAKEVLERINSVTSKNCLSLSELEKREKRAMERKLSEMEEELKQLQKLKAENERLRTENKALTRVVNKLSNSTIR